MSSSTTQDPMAQHYLECDVCETGPAQKYCHTCAGKMCETCTEDHRRKKMFQSHTITQLESAIKQTSLICSDHRTKHSEFYCKTCQKTMCVECITEKHKGHVIQKLVSFQDENRETLLKYIDRIVKIIIPAHANLLTETKRIHVEVIKSTEETCVSVQKHTENIIRAVKFAESEILAALKKSKQHMVSVTLSDQKVVSDRIARLNEIKKTLQEMHDSNSLDDNLFKQQISSIEEMEKLPEVTIVTPSRFVPGKLDHLLIKNQIGDLTSFGLSKSQRSRIHDSPAPRHLVLPKKKVKNEKLIQKPIKKTQLKTDAEEQFAIHCINTTTAVVLGNDNKIRVVDISGKVTKIATNLPHDVWPRAIALTKEKDIIYNDKYNRKVMRVSVNGNISTMFTLLTDYFPVKLSVTRSGNILISLVLKADSNDKGQRGKVVEYTTSGHTVKEFIKYNGKRIFKGPSYVLQNPVNDDIIVSDCITCTVIVLKYIGNLKFEYDGKALAKSDKFCPYQITCDSLGQILIADQYSKAIHVISQDGDPITLMLTDELHLPYGVCFDGVDSIWIAEALSRKIKIYKYLE